MGKSEIVKGIIHFGVYKETNVRLNEAKQLRELLQRTVDRTAFSETPPHYRTNHCSSVR